MKASFIGDDLSKGFNLVASVVPTSAIKQILGGVKISIVNGVANLMATDLEILVRSEIGTTSCDGDGSIVLPATRVNNILREWASSREILMEMGDGNCLLKSGGGYFKILGEDAGRFPEIGSTDIGGFVEVEGSIISNMVSKVIHAVSMVKIKSVLSGILMIVEGDTIILVAADGNRLSVIKRKVANPSSISVRGIIPIRCLTLLQRFTSDWDGVIKIGMSESRVQFVGGKVEIVSQLIDGQYP
ncbi:MAG: DNA polymerase III subunit beta, partial [Planctomycetota bacterium]